MKKKVTLYEDPLGRFHTLPEKIKEWMILNRNSVIIVGSAYHTYPDPKVLRHRRACSIYYTGTAISEENVPKLNPINKIKEVKKNIGGIIEYHFETERIDDGSYPLIIEGFPDGMNVPEQLIIEEGNTILQIDVSSEVIDGRYEIEISLAGIDKLHSTSIIILVLPTYLVEFNLQGGLPLEPTRIIDQNTKVGMIGTPTKSGYRFIGWFDQSSGGEQIDDNFLINRDIIIYAQWEIIPFIVHFDPQGGNLQEVTRLINPGGLIGELPIPTLNEYEFRGWYTAIVGGLLISPSYSVNNDSTFYARWGSSGDDDIEFGDATTQFNIQVDGDRTNYKNNPYTLYGRYSNGDTSNLTLQTGISSTDGSNNMTSSNPEVILYLKITNNGVTGEFDIGFDCDSYVNNSDSVQVTRIPNGLQLGNSYYTVTVPNDHTAWVGKYNNRTTNRYIDSPIGAQAGIPNGVHNSNTDSGYAFTIKKVLIPTESYTILTVSFNKSI